MKKLLVATALMATLASPVIADEGPAAKAANMDPAVIENAATAPSDEGFIVLGIMVTIIILAALSSGSSSSMY
jgi:hypothetical protein